MSTNTTFAERFPTTDMSWMNEELPMWIRRQLLNVDMEAMIATSRATSYVCKELLGSLQPARCAAR